jgi:hypothetical protein
MTRFLFPFRIRNTSDSYVLDSVGRPLSREDGSVYCICRWPLPAQSFSGPSPLGLVTVFYCLRFETSLFVASYDSQGHGGGIRPHLHTGFIPFITSGRTERKSPPPAIPLLLCAYSLLQKRVLRPVTQQRMCFYC